MDGSRRRHAFLIVVAHDNSISTTIAKVKAGATADLPVYASL